MIVDCHTHIFPPEIRDDRSRFFAGEPAFRLLYESPKARMVCAEQLIAAMDQQGVDRSVVFGFPWQDSETARRHNDYVLEATARFADRLVGLACVDPAAEGAAKEVERCLQAGLKGAGELAFYRSGIDDACSDALCDIMDLCRAAGVPVLLHTNEPVGHTYPGKTPNTLAQIYGLARRFADNTIILAHWGGGLFFYHLLKKEVDQVLANVYYDTAASPFLYRPEVFRLAVDLAGSDKILLGTDYPLLAADRYRRQMEQAGLSPEETARICGANAAAVFGLES